MKTQCLVHSKYLKETPTYLLDVFQLKSYLHICSTYYAFSHKLFLKMAINQAALTWLKE